MPRLHLGLALHNHQPVGNFDRVFAEAHDLAYAPMVDALERHPAVRVALHYSGPVLDWLRSRQPGLLARVRRLAARGQVELMTGGYYEPILPVIPDPDKRGQIRKMTDAVRALFGVDATGLWLAERVWEPHLPRPLAAAGVRYTIVDDAHFFRAGLGEHDLDGYFVTEETGAPLAIFPSLKALRYRIPWAQVPELMAWLQAQAARTDAGEGRADADLRPDAGDRPRLLVMGDDGEKFGLWPGTHRLCWERGWVEEFFTALEAAAGWLTTVLPGAWLARHPPRGRIYLPTAAYDEMTEWALPAPLAARLPALKHELAAQGRADLLPFLHGGYWRHFLVKYPEINTMHKAMLRASRKVWRMPRGRARATALDHLWQGQCNCPYWHGIFGGVYLGHIRAATYAHLIAAEALADRSRHRHRRRVAARRQDADADGLPEVVVTSDAQVIVIAPAAGGGIVEWDARAARVNLVNVVTRREEGYHAHLREALARGAVALEGAEQVESIHTTRVRVKELGLERHLVYDWYRRQAFLDHFLEPGAGPDRVLRWEAREVGDFITRPYRVALARRRGEVVVRLWRDGHVRAGDGYAPVRVEKTLRVPAGRAALEVAYRVTNTGDGHLAAAFAVETAWDVAGPEAEVVAAAATGRRAPGDGAGQLTVPVRQVSALRDVAGWTLRDSPRALAVDVAAPPADLWVIPIEVVSASEAGYERTFQGVTLWSVRPLHLAPGAAWEGTFRVDVRGSR
ncbi:MAG: DUF1926 domain-containing protein [Armatimonadota bacterium]|nr:DUF1926 domain-containing protein [Armatimonadota bacterium]MDR7533630.1 DUF1926 domain-containing protein [Armatimonadota bacterium]MDR7537348.1 DUF1926 domain-containing protein [Armatimonadota bacterium]